MPETSLSEAGKQRPPDCGDLKNLILDGRIDSKVPRSEKQNVVGLWF